MKKNIFFYLILQNKGKTTQPSTSSTTAFPDLLKSPAVTISFIINIFFSKFHKNKYESRDIHPFKATNEACFRVLDISKILLFHFFQVL